MTIQNLEQDAQFETQRQLISLSEIDLSGFTVNKTSGNLVGHNQKSHSDNTQRIAVLFSGGPAPGGHNVLAGIIRHLGDKHTVFGVIGGPGGLLKNHMIPLTQQHSDEIYNTGGFDFLGTDRTKISTASQFEQVRQIIADRQLTGIIIIGGDDSNTNAAYLADAVADQNCCVVGVPKTIDGDLQSAPDLPISFGFDTATKLYAELVGNIMRDAKSSLKYWHFVRLMGRSSSHVTLEVALQTQPAYTIISECTHSWSSLVDDITRVINNRATNGIHHGVILIPEGLIEQLPEFRALLDGLSRNTALSPDSQALYDSLPDSIQHQLHGQRDPHGNIPVSSIQTDAILVHALQTRSPGLINPQTHFFGYEGRCGSPSLFDAFYCLNLGKIAAQLVCDGHTGYLASLSQLDQKNPVALGIPLTKLMHTEMRNNTPMRVIKKSIVSADSPAYKHWATQQPRWSASDCLRDPGPRQLWGPPAAQLPMSVALNQHYNTYHIPRDYWVNPD